MKYTEITIIYNSGMDVLFSDVNATLEKEYLKIWVGRGFKIIPYTTIESVDFVETQRIHGFSATSIGGIRK